ncbi:hypothetical protein [Stackebrandtia soli]|uniref:hypothetical protein n=1 Tax=Stackebrandtia soli TaxID=1892856 RepID=UPI0039E9A07C
MTSICFAGVTGWAAPPILSAVHESPDLHLVAGVSRRAAGTTLFGDRRRRDRRRVRQCGRRAGLLRRLVDYTSATAVKDNVRRAVDAGVHVVIGSSGLSDADYAELDERARSRGVGVIAAGNFSIMAAILRRAAVLASEHVDRWEILDYADDTKPDVPSGIRRATWRRPSPTRVDHGSPSRSRICTVRRRRAAPKWAGHGSTRCGFPAMW